MTGLLETVAFDAIPFLVAALVGYVVAAWALTRRAWWHGVAAALGVAGFVTAVLLGRTAIADWHTERALEAAGLPLYDITGLAPDYVGIHDLGVWVSYPRASVTIRRTGTPQEECVKPGDQLHTCRESAPGRWTRSDGMGVSVFTARDGRLIEVESDEEYPAVWTLDHLTPTTAHALLSHRRPT